MAKVKEDRSRVIVEIDGNQAINTLGKLEMEAKQLRFDLKEAKKGTEEYLAASKRLKEVENEIRGVREELGLSGQTLTQLTRYQRELRKEITNTATEGTEEYEKLKKEYQDVTREINRQRKELNGNTNAVGGMNSELKKTPGFFGDIKREIKTFSVLAIGALGVSELFSGIQNLISGSAELSDAYADVQKTTGLTKAEVQDLSAELKKIDTRSSRSELLALAAEAGKLGIKGRKDILDFVNGADKINVALGEDLGEDAIKSIGKLNELFGYREIYGYGDSMLKAGSAINELGANSTASEGYIVGFTSRLGGAAKQAKITMMDIMGLGATLDSLGQQEETSSTAVGTFLVDMFKDTSTYAKIAGLEVGEFTTLLNTNANEAFVQVLEGLNGNNEGFATMVAKLQEVGVEGSRGTQVISALAGNTKLLREQQALSNKAFSDGTSILDEFNTKNQNFAGNLEKIQKWLAGAFVNSAIMNGLDKVVGKFAEWVSLPLSSKMEDERMKLNSLHAQILTTNAGTEERITLVKQLQEMMPSVLGNLDAETVSNQELSLAVREANEQLVNRIVIQSKQEQIDKNIQNQAEKKIDVINQENKLRELQTKLAEKYNLTIEEANTPMEQFETTLAKVQELEKNQIGARGRLFNQTAEFSHQLGQYADKVGFLNGMESFGNRLLEEKTALMKQLGVTMESTQSAAPVSPEGTPAVIPTAPIDPKEEAKAKKEREKAQKELEKRLEDYNTYLQKIRDLQRDYEMAGSGAHEAELLKTEYQYEAREAELKKHLDNKTITQQEYDEQLRVLQEMELQEHNRINAEYAAKAAEEQKNAERKILEATTEEKELAILKTNEHYDTLIELARTYGLDTVAIENARRVALADIQKKHDKKEIQEAAKIAEAKQMIAQGLSDSIGAVIDFIGNKQGELTAFQKILTVAGIAIDTAAALGKVIPLAIEASKGTGPAAPFVFAGYLASMAGTVLGAAAKAKNALTEAEVPDYDGGKTQSPTRGRERAPGKKSFFFGGDTGREGLGYGDQYGQFTGAVHANEYVVPSIVRKDPFVANLEPVIEEIRQDRIRGFGSQGGAAGAFSDPETKALMREMINAYKATSNKKVILVTSELEEHEDERVMLKDRYSA